MGRILGVALTVVVLLVLAVVFCPRLSNPGATIAAALLLLVPLEYELYRSMLSSNTIELPGEPEHVRFVNWDRRYCGHN